MAACSRHCSWAVRSRHRYGSAPPSSVRRSRITAGSAPVRSQRSRTRSPLSLPPAGVSKCSLGRPPRISARWNSRRFATTSAPATCAASGSSSSPCTARERPRARADRAARAADQPAPRTRGRIRRASHDCRPHRGKPVTSWLQDLLRAHPEIAFFLVLGLGYLIGRIALGGFKIGAVTGTLLAGVIVGQLGITLSDEVKQCFFLLFLFAIGFRTGPQFFRGLRSDGLGARGARRDRRHRRAVRGVWGLAPLRLRRRHRRRPRRGRADRVRHDRHGDGRDREAACGRSRTSRAWRTTSRSPSPSRTWSGWRSRPGSCRSSARS